MVTGFVGLPGAGKTYWAVDHALRAKKAGREVYANFRIDGCKKYTKLEDVMGIKKGFIIVDEINLVCPSRFWGGFPPELAYYWSQCRKNDLEIIWTAQHQDRVDKIVREVTTWIWQCTAHGLGIHTAHCWLPEHIGKESKKPFHNSIFRLKKKVYEKYNTYEMIEIAFSTKSQNPTRSQSPNFG